MARPMIRPPFRRHWMRQASKAVWCGSRQEDCGWQPQDSRGVALVGSNQAPVCIEPLIGTVILVTAAGTRRMLPPCLRWGTLRQSKGLHGQLCGIGRTLPIGASWWTRFSAMGLLITNGQECTAYATQHGTGWRADSMLTITVKKRPSPVPSQQLARLVRNAVLQVIGIERVGNQSPLPGLRRHDPTVAAPSRR